MKFSSDLITQASGSLGRLVFSQGATGGQIKLKTRALAKPTATQFTAQQILGAISKEYAGIAPAARLNWSLVAGYMKLTDILGNPYSLSGHALYVMINSNLYYTGQPRVDIAPPSVDTVPGLTSLALTATVSAAANPPDVFTATLGSNPGSYSLLIKGTGLLAAGVTKPADSAFKLLGHLDPGFPATVDLLPIFSSLFPKFTAGKNVAIRLSLVSSHGFAGPAITTLTQIASV